MTHPLNPVPCPDCRAEGCLTPAEVQTAVQNERDSWAAMMSCLVLDVRSGKEYERWARQWAQGAIDQRPRCVATRGSFAYGRGGIGGGG